MSRNPPSNVSSRAVEWTDATWNPIVGCSIVSPGCIGCYAMPMAHRIQAAAKGAASHYDGTTKIVKSKPVWTGKITRAPEYIFTAPLRWRKPYRVFVNSMGDLFHEAIPEAWIDQVFSVMALCPQHTFQVLTKRAERMREYCSTIQKNGRWLAMEDFAVALGYEPRGSHDYGFDWIANKQFLPNIWMGISCEDQSRADERIPLLLDTLAAIRFVSCEPLLGPIDLTNVNPPDNGYGGTAHGIDALAKSNRILRGILDWVIVGGETGPDARPMHPDWARSLRDQCVMAGVPYFFKQWGEWIPLGQTLPDGAMRREGLKLHYGGSATRESSYAFPERGVLVARVGKRRAGRLLDGVEHSVIPCERMEIRSDIDGVSVAADL